MCDIASGFLEKPALQRQPSKFTPYARFVHQRVCALTALAPAVWRASGSDKAQIEGVRARIVPAGGVAAKGGKYGPISQQEFAALAELLGTEGDEDDFCPTCLEAYSDGES